MGPPRTTNVPKAKTPRKEGERGSISPMKGVERPMSPMREEESAPEYTPTPKINQNKDYEECKKKVEEEMTGAVKKFTIPKIKDSSQVRMKEESRGRNDRSSKKVHDPKDKRQQSGEKERR